MLSVEGWWICLIFVRLKTVFSNNTMYSMYDFVLLGWADGATCALVFHYSRFRKSSKLNSEPISGIARACRGGWATHPEGQIEEEDEGKFRKNEREDSRMRKIEEIFLSCSPRVESLAMPPWGGFLVRRSIRGRTAEMGLKISLLV